MALFVLGSNCMGQLGLPDEISNTNKPLEHPFFVGKKIKRVCAGKLHALALCEDNTLYSWGVNDDCALGRQGVQNTPEIVPFVSEIRDIVAGASFSAVLTEKGAVYACGTFKSTSGVFGFDPTTKFQKTFKKIPNLRGITRIFAGQNHVLLVDRENNLWSFGANEAGQLGRKHRERHPERCLTAAQISNHKAGSIDDFIYAAAGGCHSLALNSSATPFGWGGNFNGQIGDGTTSGSEIRRPSLVSGVKSIACGSSHSLFLKNNGDLFGCGDNTLSQLGISGKKMYTEPVLVMQGVEKVQAGCDFAIALLNREKKAGEEASRLVSWGSNMNGELGFNEIEFDEIFTPTEIKFDFGEIVDFACGTDFTMVLTK